MLDIQSMILSQRIITLKRYIEEYSNPWKTILDTFLGEVGGKFILHCNFDTRKLPIYLPDFYKECLEAWSDVTKTGNGEWGMGNGMIPGNGKLKWEFEKKIKKSIFFKLKIKKTN